MNRVHTGAYFGLAFCLVLVGYLLSQNRKQDSRLKETETRLSSAEVQLEMERKKNEVLEQNKTRVVIVTKPDGTRVETREDTKTTKKTETDTRIAQDERKTERIETKKESESVAKQTKYSVTPEWRDLGPYAIPTGASVGARLGTLPLWLEVGWDRKAGAHAGVRFEW